MSGTSATVERNTVLPKYTFPKVAFLLGIILFMTSNLYYVINEPEFNNFITSARYSYASLSIVLLASLFLALSAISYLRIQQEFPISIGEDSKHLDWKLGRIVSDVVSKQRKLFFSAITTYGIFFALLDGILIYQPNVDFTVAYAANGSTWRVATCCGTPGYVPIGLLYLPAEHLGVQLIPISVLLMIFVSVLVAMNIALLARAYTLSKSGNVKSTRKGLAGSVIGAVFGLFVGCPTCAAAFLFSMIAGTGALTFSALISAYQPIITSLTLPLLFFLIFWQTRSIRTILQGCTLASEPS